MMSTQSAVILQASETWGIKRIADSSWELFVLEKMVKCQVSSTCKRVSIFAGFIPPFHSIPFHSIICSKERKSSSGRGYSRQCLFCGDEMCFSGGHDIFKF